MLGRHIGDTPSDWRPDGSEFLVANAGGVTRHTLGGKAITMRRNIGGNFMCAGAWSPTGNLIFVGKDASMLLCFNADDLQIRWSAVVLPEDQSVTFSASGDVIDGTREVLDKQFVYYTEGDDGRIETLSPTEFEKLIELPLVPAVQADSSGNK